MLSGMLTRSMQPLLPVDPGNVPSVVERLIKCVNDLIFDEFNIEDIRFTDRASIRWLSSFVGMELKLRILYPSESRTFTGNRVNLSIPALCVPLLYSFSCLTSHVSF